jgi:O-methyltransferase domain/Dimerisation domain
MGVVGKKSIEAVISSAVTQPSEEQTDKRRESQVSPLSAVHHLVTGRFAADIVGVAAELGLADQIHSGPKTAEEIAAALGLHASSLYRLLRALANFGIFAEQEDGRFRQTPMSDTLRSDVPHSMHGMARMNFRPWTMRAWTVLEHTVRTGTPAFEHAHGMQMFEYLTQHPEEMEIFVDAMQSFTVETGAAVSEAYDFSGIGTLADIGGSRGLVLSIMLTKYPLLRGILFDLPIVIEGASKFLRSRGVEHRVELRTGSFFESVPSGADIYLLKHILHDWSDADCVRILKTIQAAAKPGSKLLAVEAIVEKSSEPQFAMTLDIWMLAHLRGKERTRTEWQNLLNAGGFRLSRTIPTTSFVSVIEAIRE